MTFGGNFAKHLEYTRVIRNHVEMQHNSYMHLVQAQKLQFSLNDHEGICSSLQSRPPRIGYVEIPFSC